MDEDTIVVNKNSKSRLGCSVCQKTNFKDVFLVNSFNKLKLGTKQKAIAMKFKKCESITSIPSKECYCSRMEQIQDKVIPRLICSKRYKTPSNIAIDYDWLNEMKEFRRENWFDCHSDSFVDTEFVKSINSLCLSEEHELNCNHNQDLILLDHIKCNNLKTKTTNKCLESCPTKVYIQDKIIKPKFSGENKNITKKINFKPWIPPSISH